MVTQNDSRKKNYLIFLKVRAIFRMVFVCVCVCANTTKQLKNYHQTPNKYNGMANGRDSVGQRHKEKSHRKQEDQG